MKREEIELIEELIIGWIEIFELNGLDYFPEEAIEHEEQNIEKIKKKLELIDN